MLTRVWRPCLLPAQSVWKAHWFSTWKPSISPEKQREILRVAQCVHELEGKPKRTNLTPFVFTVPATAPFPEDLHGTKFSIKVFRRAYHLGLLSEDIVSQLDAIGFVWNGREGMSIEAWEENLEAIRMYKSIHGYLSVPRSYKVKVGDVQWPPKLWGKNLGYAVVRLRTQQETMDPARREMLDSVGFIWDAIQANWEKNLLALETYKAIEGDLLVKKRFVVPDQDPAWPKDTWNVKLGYLVDTCRKKKASLPPKIRDALNAMGFVWKVRDPGTGPSRPPSISMKKQNQILEIVQAQYNLQDHTKFTTLPSPFKVPSSSKWSQHLHGCSMNTTYFRRAYRLGLLEASIVAKLDEIGFVWDDNQHQWSLLMEALEIFKKIYGHVNVPSGFEVPEDDPVWPNYLWGMKLGTRIGPIRRGQTKLTLEKRQELEKMNFIWDARELHRNVILLALKTYKEIYDNLYVPSRFVVPSDDPEWPPELAGMKLGVVVNNLLNRRATTSDELKKGLEELGFEWHRKS
ncbi:hypothetical protein Ae201684P_020151 [Aphanomyces euteiches]|uniref:Helicase-associated domain-containing protein n=1 Tax=Aphanomyces euteiches TaxID=100861 RepID=A0A6G0W7L8_9STRA|nr:hypothetical protein Ae201684_018643 [Aphanomyces euteiches]KAH9071893.1 hypothetical protein Ae201684P_020151 [Aphanomyces euteiches]KAH9156343.1 hypothetical protein AeRB84_001736 [Aphanomyces euteiches]